MTTTQNDHPFGEYTATGHALTCGGDQYRFEFPNGYGASVVCHEYSYGGPQGKWELAVTDANGLCYDTPITDDVIGWLEPFEVGCLLERIAQLPPKN